MRIELGGPVVAELRGEAVVWERLHLAGEEKRWSVHGGDRWTHKRTLYQASHALTWPTLCGLEGYLYALGGPIRENVRDGSLRFCAVCVERCNRDLRGRAFGWTPLPDLRAVA